MDKSGKRGGLEGIPSASEGSGKGKGGSRLIERSGEKVMAGKGERGSRGGLQSGRGRVVKIKL